LPIVVSGEVRLGISACVDTLFNGPLPYFLTIADGAGVCPMTKVISFVTVYLLCYKRLERKRLDYRRLDYNRLAAPALQN
jgi:hypothetical protein